MSKAKTQEKTNVKVQNIKFDNETITDARELIKMVGSGYSLGATLLGPAGMGKTHIVTNTLEEMGLKENEDWIVYGGHITLISLYEFLYEHRDKIILFDDTSQLVNKVENMELLKQAIDPSGRPRVLHYRSKGLSEHIRDNFEFTGKIIFTFNKINVDDNNVKAILSRATLIELNFSRKEILNMFYKIGTSNFGDLLEHEKLIVIKEIEDHTDNSMIISIRKLEKSFSTYRYYKNKYGVNNQKWIGPVRKIHGKKIVSVVVQIVNELCEENKTECIEKIKVIKELMLMTKKSKRTIERKLKDSLDLQEIFSDGKRYGNLSLTSFTARVKK